MTGRKGALTTYYPEETRADYAAGNRGKHILTQRPDGTPQCIACNMCATVCPAQVIEIDAAFDPDDAAHPKYPSRFEIDYSRCIFCGLCVEACPEDAIRMVKEVPEPAVGRPRPHVARRWTSSSPGIRRATSPSRTRRARGQAAASRRTRMIENLLQNLDTLLLVVFGVSALVAAALMIVLRHPMQVAMALISTMVFLGGIYGLLGVHFIAAFQVLIYVSAVMVFMVYVIMLLDVRDPSFTQRFSTLARARQSSAACCCSRCWRTRCWHGRLRAGQHDGLVRPAAVLGRLPQRVLAALRAHVGAAGGGGRRGAGRHQGQRKRTMDKLQFLLLLAVALFALGLLGVIVRRNLLVMLMCMELMLNGVNLSLVTFAQQTGTAAGAVLVFLIFVVAAAEIAIAIPIVLLLVRRKRTLEADAYADLKG